MNDTKTRWYFRLNKAAPIGCDTSDPRVILRWVKKMLERSDFPVGASMEIIRIPADAREACALAMKSKVGDADGQRIMERIDAAIDAFEHAQQMSASDQADGSNKPSSQMIEGRW